MFSIPKTMLSMDKRGLLFAGKHILTPACPETSQIEINHHLMPVLTKLSAAYMRPMEGNLAALLRKAATAWNRGDTSRAAHDLVYARLPDPKDDADFYERLRLVDKALALGTKPEAILKSLDMDVAWIGEARVPAGEPGAGEWTNGNDDGDDGDDDGDVTDVAAKNPCNDVAAMNFVRRYKDEAAAVASQYGIPTSYVLGLAARESGNGSSSFTSQNAFFNLEKVLPEGQKPTQSDIDKIPHAVSAKSAKEKRIKNNTRAWVYTYKNFTDSAKSFLDLYGDDVKDANSSKDFLQMLQDNGFNGGSGFLDSEPLDETAQRIQCAEQN